MTPSFQQTTRYQAHDAIGKGGVGQVFRAWDTQLNRWVALKRLSPQEDGTVSVEDQIWQEITTTASLQHPNVVTIYDFGADEHGPFMVMELLEGENLEQVVERGTFPLAEFSLFARQCLEGIIAAHHVGLIHRDLKPSNIMLIWLPSGAFQVKILDFGLARFISAPQLQTVDQEGSLMGSIYTMAPEQFNREPLDGRTDLYALGCIFYYTAAGQFPFRGETVNDVMIAHLQHHVTSLEQIRRDLPHALCRWIMRLLSVDPHHRYENASEALKVLNEIVEQESKVLRQPTTLAPHPAQVLTWVWAALTVAAFAGGGFWWWSHSKSPPAVREKTVATAPAEKPVAPVAESVSAPSPVPASATPASEAPAVGASETLSVRDLAALRAHLGQQVVVEGKVVLTGENKTGTVRYLNFDRDYKQALALVFFLNQIDAPLDKLQTYVDHDVQVRGVLSEHKDTIQIVIKDWSQITSK